MHSEVMLRPAYLVHRMVAASMNGDVTIKNRKLH